MKKLFLAEVEVVPLPRSELHGEIVGGFLSVFVPAEDPVEAREKLMACLKSEFFSLKNLETLEAFDPKAPPEWGDEDMQAEMETLAFEASRENECAMSALYSYDEDEDDEGK